MEIVSLENKYILSKFVPETQSNYEEDNRLWGKQQ